MRSPVVLITGALTGIGRATAITFAQEGAKVVVSGRREKEGKELVAELQKLEAEAIFVRTDVRNDDAVRKLVDQTVSGFGRLDIAVKNALKLPDCRYQCSRLRFPETPPTRHIPHGRSTSAASVGDGAP